MRKSTVVVCVGLCLLASMARAERQPVIPVLLATPACKYQKLGTVSIEEGHRVNENTRDTNLPSANYRLAFVQLADAAVAKGANAVVVYWHQAAYYTRFGRRTRQPVYVRLSGAAVHIDDAPESCALQVADPHEFAARAARGEPVNVTSDEAYKQD